MLENLSPLLFSFQFTPATLARGRTATFAARGAGGTGAEGGGCRDGSEQMARGEPKAAATQTAGKPPAKKDGGATFDDMDDDIPF